MQANKNGFFYVLDRQTGEFLSGKPFVPVNWASGLDGKGRALENASALYGNKPAFVAPAPAGGHNWQPVSFNPDSKIIYIPAQDSAQPFVGSHGGDIHLGGWNTGVDFGGIAKLAEAAAAAGTPAPPRVGELLAWDVVNQKEVWRVKHPTFWNGGTLVTAGNLVFQGLGDGTFNAWSADKGEKVWKRLRLTWFPCPRRSCRAGSFHHRLLGLLRVDTAKHPRRLWKRLRRSCSWEQ